MQTALLDGCDGQGCSLTFSLHSIVEETYRGVENSDAVAVHLCHPLLESPAVFLSSPGLLRIFPGLSRRITMPEWLTFAPHVWILRITINSPRDRPCLVGCRVAWRDFYLNTNVLFEHSPDGLLFGCLVCERYKTEHLWKKVTQEAAVLRKERCLDGSLSVENHCTLLPCSLPFLALLWPLLSKRFCFFCLRPSNALWKAQQLALRWLWPLPSVIFSQSLLGDSAAALALLSWCADRFP